MKTLCLVPVQKHGDIHAFLGSLLHRHPTVASYAPPPTPGRPFGDAAGVRLRSERFSARRWSVFGANRRHQPWLCVINTRTHREFDPLYAISTAWSWTAWRDGAGGPEWDRRPATSKSAATRPRQRPCRARLDAGHVDLRSGRRRCHCRAAAPANVVLSRRLPDPSVSPDHVFGDRDAPAAARCRLPFLLDA